MTPAGRAKRLVDEAWADPGRWEDHLGAAEALLRAAAAADPADPIPLICLGAVLSDRGHHAQAIPVLEQAIRLGSRDRNAYQNLAIALLNTGPDGRARAQPLFEAARELAPSPDTWEAYFDPHGH